MKKLIVLVVLFACSACGGNAVEKPDNLIEEDKMAEILYDFSILEAMKSQKSVQLAQSGVDATTYIFEKHKIDSTQFANSNKYYASDIERYKELYDKVKEKIEAKKTTLGSSPRKTSGDDDAPQIQ